jgi:hypothetical protein
MASALPRYSGGAAIPTIRMSLTIEGCTSVLGVAFRIDSLNNIALSSEHKRKGLKITTSLFFNKKQD